MLKLNYIATFLITASIAVSPAQVFSEDSKQAEREAMYQKCLGLSSYVKAGRGSDGGYEPHWMNDGNSFWFAEGYEANTVIWKVDPTAQQNRKTVFLIATRLRDKLKTLGLEPPGSGLPFDTFDFADENETSIRFAVEQQDFILDLRSYSLAKLPAETEEEKQRSKPRSVLDMHGGLTQREIRSPDGRWFLGHEDFNVYLRSVHDGKQRQLALGGTEHYRCGK